MKSLFLLAIAAALPAADISGVHGDIGVDVFGLSYHSNKYAIYNQVNPGLGITVGLDVPSVPWLDVVAAGGTYKDSYFFQARYAMAGVRVTVGNKTGLNAKLTLVGGYQDGSDKDGLGFFPILSVGYDRFSICVTGDPSHDSNPTYKTSNSHAYTTSMLAVFADIEVYRF
jgi:hypothetical protein